MAGNKVYIEPIISQATEGLQDLVNDIDTSVNNQITELENVASILNNILKNTGITIQQKAFNGTTFSGLTAYPYQPNWYRAIDTQGNISYRNNQNFTITENSLLISAGANMFNSYPAYLCKNIDLTDIDYISGSVTKTNYCVPAIYVDDTRLLSAEGDFNIDLSGYTGEHLLKIGAAGDGHNTSTTTTVNYTNLSIGGSGLDVVNTMSFNSNILVSDTAISGKGGAAFFNFAGSITDTINMWSNIIIQGNLDSAADIYILDTTFQPVYKILNGDLSNVALYSDFYIAFVTKNNTDTISNVLLRYC